MKSILSKWIRYNANTNDKSVGDCVKRSLSYAYGVDYDEISRQLNRIKNEIGSFAFNTTRTYTEFLKRNNAVKLSDDHTGMTEEEFSKLYPTGVYIILSGSDKKTYATHMVCIMNGDIIDSWNSSSYVVREAWKIQNVSLDTFELDWSDVEEYLNKYIDNYIESINKKSEGWFEVCREDGYRLNDLTGKMKFYLRVGDVPQESDYHPFRKYMKLITVKLNPRLDLDQNIKSLEPKLKQRVYDWVYPFQKDMRDTIAIQDMGDVKYKDQWSKKQLLKLPEWVRPLVEYFSADDRWNYKKYELVFRALPDDPYAESGDRPKTVRIETDSYKELKDSLAAYKEDFSRLGYDY